MDNRRLPSPAAKPAPPSRPNADGHKVRERPTQPRTSADTVRQVAAWAVDRTLESMAPATLYLQSGLERCAEPDHGLLRELTLGTLRWLRRLDAVIAQASQRSMEAIEPALRTPLRIAAYQLLFLDRIPAHAAVNEGVEHARLVTHRGGAAFANAVLRRIARDPELAAWPVQERDPIRKLAIEQSHPDFLVRRWHERFGEARTRALLEANNRPKAMSLLAFRDRGGRELLAEQLIDEGVEVEAGTLAPCGLVVRAGNPLRGAAHARGELYVQDEASQAAALIPAPKPGERILDAAAAPGGKGFALLALEPTIELVMADVAPARLFTLRENLRRLRRLVACVGADAAAPPWARPFDRVVVDLPCTGTGTLRKHPELKWRISEPEIGRLRQQALRLLRGLAPAVAPGGLLVAITCSLEREENEDVVAAFLAGTPEFRLEPLDGALPRAFGRYVEALGRWRILPDLDHDGFTVHVLRRAAAEAFPR
jgi:16S rRNA (cytosine967-C5)-methyltransferase